MADILINDHGDAEEARDESRRLGIRLTATPHARTDVVPDPEATPASADRDWRLVSALRLRKPTAADRLVATYGDRAYRLAVRITGSEQDAEEAVQDAFWSVVRKIDTFRGDSAFGSWVYRIVTNAAYETMRRRPQALVDISLDEVLPPFDEQGRHAGMLGDWSSRLDDPAVQTELRDVLNRPSQASGSLSDRIGLRRRRSMARSPTP